MKCLDSKCRHRRNILTILYPITTTRESPNIRRYRDNLTKYQLNVASDNNTGTMGYNIPGHRIIIGKSSEFGRDALKLGIVKKIDKDLAAGIECILRMDISLNIDQPCTNAFRVALQANAHFPRNISIIMVMGCIQYGRTTLHKYTNKLCIMNNQWDMYKC